MSCFCSVAQLCLTLCDPMDHQPPLFMGFPRQEYSRGLPVPPPGDLPNPGIKPMSPALQADSLLCEPLGKYLGRKAMTNLDSILKSREITLSTKLHQVKAMVFPVVMYGCESWTEES